MGKEAQNRDHAHLHALVGVDPAALQQVDVEGLVDGPQRRGVLLHRGITGDFVFRASISGVFSHSSRF